jgi:hypothetical protein
MSGRQLLATARATGAQDVATANRGRTGAKAVTTGANEAAGLKGALHETALFRVRMEGAGNETRQTNPPVTTDPRTGIRRWPIRKAGWSVKFGVEARSAPANAQIKKRAIIYLANTALIWHKMANQEKANVCSVQALFPR